MSVRNDRPGRLRPSSHFDQATDEDEITAQLREQAKFLSSGKPAAATVQRGPPPPIGGKTVHGPLSSKRPADLLTAPLPTLNHDTAPQLRPHVAASNDGARRLDLHEALFEGFGAVLAEVKEREHWPTTGPTCVRPQYSQPSGFPRAMHRSQLPERKRAQLRTPRQAPQGLAAGRKGGDEMAAATTIPGPLETASDPLVIHRENLLRISQMSQQHLAEAQQELRTSLAPVPLGPRTPDEQMSAPRRAAPTLGMCLQGLQEKLHWLGARRKAAGGGGAATTPDQGQEPAAASHGTPAGSGGGQAGVELVTALPARSGTALWPTGVAGASGDDGGEVALEERKRHWMKEHDRAEDEADDGQDGGDRAARQLRKAAQELGLHDVRFGFAGVLADPAPLLSPPRSSATATIPASSHQALHGDQPPPPLFLPSAPR